MAAPKARDISQQEADFLRTVFERGWDEALRQFGIAEDAAQQILNNAGLSEPQVVAMKNMAALTQSGVIDIGNLPAGVNELVQQAKQLTQQAIEISQNPQTPEQRAAVLQATQIAQGTSKDQHDLRQFALHVMGQRRPELEQVSQSARDTIASGGQTEDINRIKQAGFALAEAGGFTPELRALLSQATTLMNTNGALTPALREVFDLSIAMAKGNRSALLPLDKVIEFARDEAGTAIRSAAKQNIKEALARGGGPGALFSGPGGDSLAEFADQSAQLQASAVKDALLRQQTLKMQEQQSALQQAGQAASAGAQLDAARLSAGGALTADVLRAAGANVSGGLSAALGAEQLVSTRLADAGKLALDTEGQIFGEAARGTEILQGLTQSQVQGGALVNEIQQGAFNNKFNALNLAHAGQDQTLAGLSFGAGLQQQSFQNQLAANQALFGAGQTGQSNVLDAAQIIAGQGNAFLNFGGSALDASSRARTAAAAFQAQPGVFSSVILPSIISGAAGAGSAALGNR